MKIKPYRLCYYCRYVTNKKSRMDCHVKTQKHAFNKVDFDERPKDETLMSALQIFLENGLVYRGDCYISYWN